MKGKNLFSICTLIMLSVLLQPAALPLVNVPGAKAKAAPALPDLIAYWAIVKEPKNGKFDIRIKNIGAASAKSSVVVLKLKHVASPGARPKEMMFRAVVPAISAGSQTDVVISTNLDLSLDSSCAIADYGNQIAESNETNNQACGPVDS